MKPTISIVDYGLGNIFSVSRAVADAGFKFKLVCRPHEIADSEYLLLPGVGSFQRGMSELKIRGLIESIHEYVLKGKPILGICLGMQFLFESSEEGSGEKGFGFIPGKVVRIAPNDAKIKVPHIGWSCLKANPENPAISDKENNAIMSYVDKQFVYFVHSYHPDVESQYLMATSDYKSYSINAMVRRDNVIGCQFHPEKSGKVGSELLRVLLSEQVL